MIVQVQGLPVDPGVDRVISSGSRASCGPCASLSELGDIHGEHPFVRRKMEKWCSEGHSNCSSHPNRPQPFACTYLRPIYGPWSRQQARFRPGAMASHDQGDVGSGAQAVHASFEAALSTKE